ncbi:hypothetical protein [Vibrio ulleungensis]|uniref:Uncharacterized protein n=1 Tax=Vibrio ulleungensis TaxID=2807619 RepID=A0ABS2HIS9_9VIBR|nr:hypothetical protein [Vibrio ulleungensis]MBM7035757.1 hypothetical protein [Vibrio ulleungensis]
MNTQQFDELKSMISMLSLEQMNQIQNEIQRKTQSQRQELVTDEESDYIQSLFH